MFNVKTFPTRQLAANKTLLDGDDRKMRIRACGAHVLRAMEPESHRSAKYGGLRHASQGFGVVHRVAGPCLTGDYKLAMEALQCFLHG